MKILTVIITLPISICIPRYWVLNANFLASQYVIANKPKKYMKYANTLGPIGRIWVASKCI